MYRNQFRPDRFNDHANPARRSGRGCGGGRHHWVVSGGRGSAAPGARPRSPPNRSGRPGSVQQYRPRSPARALPQGNATNRAPIASATDTHTEPVNRACLGSLENQRPPNVPDQSDGLNLESAEGARPADSSTQTIHSEGYSSTAFTLQFGTLSTGVINKQCIPCTTSAPPDLNEKKHEKAHHGLSSDRPNTVSEQQKQEATNELVISRQVDMIDKYDSVPATVSSNACVVPERELPLTPLLISVPPDDKVCTDSCKVLPRSPSSPTHQQWQKQYVRKDVIDDSQSDNIHKCPATKPKISVQIPAPYNPNMAPPSFMLPVAGRSLPVAFQQKQPQLPVEFRGPGVQIQSIGSVSGSLPVKMAVPVGNTPHVPPFFVHGAQPRALQQQSFIHPGQGLGCSPPASHHFPRSGNMKITQELSQQHPRSCDEQKRPIRITHPETHEELMLDRRGHSYMDAPSGQMPLHNMNQLTRPVPTFPPLHKVYYRPNMYNTGPIYLPNTSTIPLANWHMCPKMQSPRHSFDPTINNQPITSIKHPMPNPWLDASPRPPTNLRVASEMSNFKGLLPSTMSAPVQGALKQPTIFLAEKNEVSSQTSIPTCVAETPTLLRYSGESALSSQQRVDKFGLEISPDPEKLVSAANLKLPAATSGVSCSMSSQSVSTQKTQTGSALVGRATSIAGPQIISGCNLTSACVASGTSSVKSKHVLIEESSPVPAATSSSDAKGQLSHIVSLQSEGFLDTEASIRSHNVSLTVASLGSDNIDDISLGSKNSKYDGNSILGKPPLIYTQETMPPKFRSSSTFTEGHKAKVNPVSFPEETSEANCSVPLQIQDVMREEHIVNAEVMCSKSKAEQVVVTIPGAASGSENRTDVGKSIRFPACAESGDLDLSLSIGDLPPSNKDSQPSSDAQIGTCEPENKLKDSILDSARILTNTALLSNSTSSQRKMEHESIDSGVPNHCFAVAQTRNPGLEANKAKITHGRRKKRKEILPKSDGQKSYDVYNASASLNENFVSFNAEEVVRSSSTVDLKESCTLDAEVGTSTGGNDNQNKNGLFNWEGDTDIPSEKLRAYSCKHSNNGVEVNKDKYEYDQKRYSRDFLLTIAQSSVNLPDGFKIGPDIYDAIMNISNEHHPNRARIKERVSATSHVNRHTASSKLDENNWRKSYPYPVSGCDPLPDTVHRPAFSSWDAAQRSGRGSSRSVSQNQSSSQYAGEILSRAVKEVVSQRSMSRGSVNERWQHRTNVQGVSSPSQASMPLMHKAEKKYEIGKVSDEEEAKQRQLKAILNKLTPQNFEKLFEQVKDLNIDNIVTLTGVISQIFDKALMEPTFCEMYASFCFSLAGELPNFVKDDEKITFKRLLLNKCQEEFERGEREQAEAERAEEDGGMKQSEGEREDKRLRARRRMLGNIRLIGELYKKKMLTERIMHECIKKLLGEYQHPDEEDLEALCKLMSTIGEMIDHSRAKVHLDFYFDIIQKLSANSKLSSRIRFMLEDVIDLRNNKWRQRRKVEGPKKIEEVRRDAIKLKMSQSTRLGNSPNYNSPATSLASRSGPPPDYGVRGSSAFASRGSSQARAYGSQNVNLDTRYQPSNRTLSALVHQRRSDKSIRLGPQGDLGREMSLCGKPPVSNDNFPEVPLNSHHGQTSKNSRQSSFTGAACNQTNFQATAGSPKSQSWETADHALPLLVTAVNPVVQMRTPPMVIKDMCYEARVFPEEVLQEKAILTIKEFYSAKDEKEVGLCMKELNAPSFYPSLLSLWINDSFQRKDLERELLANLLVNLCKSQESLLSQRVLLQGFQNVLSTLEDAVTDAPKATEFLGRIFAKVILEDVLSLTEIGLLLQDGGEEPTRPVSDQRLASEVLGSMLESIRVERGDSDVDEIRAKSNLHWESLRRPMRLIRTGRQDVRVDR